MSVEQQTDVVLDDVSQSVEGTLPDGRRWMQNVYRFMVDGTSHWVVGSHPFPEPDDQPALIDLQELQPSPAEDITEDYLQESLLSEQRRAQVSHYRTITGSVIAGIYGSLGAGFTGAAIFSAAEGDARGDIFALGLIGLISAVPAVKELRTVRTERQEAMKHKAKAERIARIAHFLGYSTQQSA